MVGQALSGLTVVELACGVGGAYTTKLLAGFGAEVIKVEPPGAGDPLRRVGPFAAEPPDLEQSLPFLWLNTGKKSVTADVRQAAGVHTVAELSAGADVLVLGGAPSLLDSLGLGADLLLARNPRLIITSITNFGRTGPYRDFEADEIVSYAMSGLMYLTGDPDRPPLRAAPLVCQYTAGMNAYVATLMALYQREATGRGQLIDVSVQESALDNIEVAFAEYLHAGRIARRTGDEHALVPWQLMPCRDGYAAVIGGPIRRWLTAAPMFEEPRLLESRYQHMRDRISRREEVMKLLQPWLDQHDCKDVYHRGQQSGLAFGYLAEHADVLASPQHAARNFFVAIDHPVAGRQTYCGAPFRLSEGGWLDRPAPLLGQHDDEILGRLAGTADPAAGNIATTLGTAGRSADVANAPVDHPLAGVTVVDLTHDWAGPHATRMLADFGAQVIKVEYVRRLDGMRGAVVEDRAYDRHPRWLEINRNKLSVTLDLTTEPGLRAFRQLVGLADVVVESSRVGVLERLGLGYPQLKAIKPDIVLVRMAPFGQTGPEAGYGGYGGCLEPLAGIQTLTGYDAASPPRRLREMDVTNGILGACAIMTALVHRRRTGRGQWVDLSQLETATNGLIGEYLLEYAATGRTAERLGNRHPRLAPHGCYQCAGDDAWVVVAVRDNADWAALCAVIGRPDLITDELATPAGRAQVHDDLDRIIEAWTIRRTPYQAMHELQASRVPAGAVLTVADLACDPHLQARGFVLRAADGTPEPFPGLPFQLSGARGGVARRGPHLGEHNHHVLAGLLGWPDDAIQPVDPATIGTAFDPFDPREPGRGPVSRPSS